MNPPMTHTAGLITNSRNAYGDYTASGTTNIACHFREINEVITNSNNEAVQSDAIAWFEPASGVTRESLLLINSEYYRVVKIVKARRLRSPAVLFVKAYLRHYGVIS
jgi:hypothetical protein